MFIFILQGKENPIQGIQGKTLMAVRNICSRNNVAYVFRICLLYCTKDFTLSLYDFCKKLWKVIDCRSNPVYLIYTLVSKFHSNRLCVIRGWLLSWNHKYSTSTFSCLAWKVFAMHLTQLRPSKLEELKQ